MHVEWRTLEPGKRKLVLIADTQRESHDLALLAYALSMGGNFNQLELQTVDGQSLMGINDLSSFRVGYAEIANVPLVHKLLAENWKL